MWNQTSGIYIVLWRIRASIPSPLTCKASALPSELIPLTAVNITREILRGIVPVTKCFKVNMKSTWAIRKQQFLHISKLEAVILRNNLLENTGIDPVTSRMLSEHSTIWANSPFAQLFHKVLWCRGLAPQSQICFLYVAPKFIAVILKQSLDSSVGRASDF